MYVHKSSIRKIHANSYEFKPSGRFIYMKNLLWKILKKTNCLKLYFDEKEVIERVDIDSEKLYDKIYKQYFSILDRGFKPKHVYIGIDEFQDVSGLTDNNGNYNMQFDMKLNYNKTLFNLPVTVLPYMKGLLIV
jgi:hypothetical protein